MIDLTAVPGFIQDGVRNKELGAPFLLCQNFLYARHPKNKAGWDAVLHAYWSALFVEGKKVMLYIETKEDAGSPLVCRITRLPSSSSLRKQRRPLTSFLRWQQVYVAAYVHMDAATSAYITCSKCAKYAGAVKWNVAIARESQLTSYKICRKIISSRST